MSNRILDLLREGRLTRGTYAGTDEQGRQMLCLLTALTGDPSTRPDTCPASVAPAWIAYLAPWWDDSGTIERWPGLMRQIGELAPRFGELVGETGRRALAGCQLVTLRVALRHADEARPVVERVIALWERVLLGDEPSPQEWEAAARAATLTARTALTALTAAWAAAWAAACAAAWEEAAAAAAARKASVAAATAARTASEEAADAAEAADEIIQGHIDAIRDALGTADGGVAWRNILDLLRDGRLARGTYATTDDQGRKMLCLLTALTGDPETRPYTCPASVAPVWVAYLAPWWDDSGTQARWPDLMRQIGELAPRFGELAGETGRRALAGCQLVTLRVALRHAAAARPVVARVIELWERVLHGDEPTTNEWIAAADAAWAAQVGAVAEAARKVAWVAWVATDAEGAAAAEAARAVALAVAWAAACAAAWEEAAAAAAARKASVAAATAARTASEEAADAAEAADEIIQGHIDAIRDALGTADGGVA